MSIPQIFLTASGSSRPSTTQNDSQRIQSFNLPTTSKEHIRERLNLHVKKRIQSHDQPQYPMLSTSPTTSLYATTASALKPTHPFLMTGTKQWRESYSSTFSCARHLAYAQFSKQNSMHPISQQSPFWFNCRCIDVNATGYGICKFTHFRGIQLQTWSALQNRRTQIGCWTTDANSTNRPSIVQNEAATKKDDEKKAKRHH